jgi:hypothetical protein
MYRKPNKDLREITLPSVGKKMRVNDAEDYLQIAVSTLNKLRCSGEGPAFYKLGKSVIYCATDLDRWLSAHRRTSTSGDHA